LPVSEFITIGSVKFVGELHGSHMHVSVLGAGPLGHRPLCGMLRMTIAEWQKFAHIGDILVTMRSVVGDWAWAELAEDAHGTDYQGALAAVARLERELAATNEHKPQAGRGEPGRQAGEG
jgi:hypothetical protein